MRFELRWLTTISVFGLFGTTPQAHGSAVDGRTRTVITTDMEQDDLASLIRYLLYANEFDTQGLIYTTSRFHWAGDGNGTEFFLPDREYNSPQTEWRWTGTRYIQDIVLPAYANVFPNLINHDPMYPTPEQLQSVVKVGNIIFEGEMDQDTDGSDLIRSLLLDQDPRTLYIQAWGGTSTIARALKSIEENFSQLGEWHYLQGIVSAKAVILASGFQDETYADYISIHWPDLRVHQLAGGYHPWSYHCQGSTYGLPEDQVYWSGQWTKKNIQIGPLGKLYRSWLDGQSMLGDPLDIFGDPAKAPNGWCKPLEPYDFLSEGDNVAFNPLIITGLQDPSHPEIGGWGGRLIQNSRSPNLWEMVAGETAQDGAVLDHYTVTRWVAPIQNDFAARMQWTLVPEFGRANHAPSVRIMDGGVVGAKPGSTLKLRSVTDDPDGDTVAVSWWQYLEEGTYPHFVEITEKIGGYAMVKVPADANVGQTVSIILQGTDDGLFPLTRYDRVMIQVE